MRRLSVLLLAVMAILFTACQQTALTYKPVIGQNAINKKDKLVVPQYPQPKKVFYSGKAVVLTYHHISTRTKGPITISPQRFEGDLKMLKSSGFNVISLRQLLSAMDGNYKMPANAVVITFDDGIESFYKYAYPLLKKYDMPAAQFVITARNAHYKPTGRDLNPLSPEEITEMYVSGLVDIQSHTNNSHDYGYIDESLKKGAMLTNKLYDPATKHLETDEEYVKRVTDDLNTSRSLIYDYTGAYPDVLCFPFGRYTKEVVSLSRQVGFKYFVTTIEGVNRQDSKSSYVYRIRAGDEKLNSEKLMQNIIKCGSGAKL